ncbi:MAG: hypothetical protein COS25_00205, partial [Candidatus Nealsonbacteria bacterium CG02_land_8_20_14_3_00_37_10]
PKNLAKSVTVE